MTSDLLREIRKEQATSVADELRAFLDAAGGEGLVLAGIDAGDLFMKLYEPARASLAQPPAAPKCDGCNGHGMVGGLRPDGYDAEECPFCKGSGIASQALARVPEGWRPIDTAPDDMAAYLFRVNGVALEGFKDATGQLCVRNERHEWRAMRGKPTHWMPMPAAPTAPAPKEKP